MTYNEFCSLEVTTSYRGFFNKGWYQGKLIKFYCCHDTETCVTDKGERLAYQDIKQCHNQGRLKAGTFYRPSIVAPSKADSFEYLPIPSTDTLDSIESDYKDRWQGVSKEKAKGLTDREYDELFVAMIMPDSQVNRKRFWDIYNRLFAVKGR